MSVIKLKEIRPLAGQTGVDIYGDANFQGKATGNGAVPIGGSAGQVLQKKSNSDHDLEWSTPSNIGKNDIINGSCDINQRPTYILDAYYNSGWVIGSVDMIGMKLKQTTGNPSVGAFTQSTAGYGSSGKEACFSWINLGAGGEVFWGYRMEYKDAITYKNKNGVAGCWVRHDTGAAVNFNITVRKANAADNFATTTQIAASDPVSVPSGVSTFLTLAIPSATMGDCSNGLEIEIHGTPGAVTQKNFYLFDLKMEKGLIATEFQRMGRCVGEELSLCQRYYEKSFPMTTPPAQGTNVGRGEYILYVLISNQYATIPFITPKRAWPNMSFYDPILNAAGWHNYSQNQTRTATLIEAGECSFKVMTDGSSSINQRLGLHWVAQAELF